MSEVARLSDTKLAKRFADAIEASRKKLADAMNARFMAWNGEASELPSAPQITEKAIRGHSAAEANHTGDDADATA